MFKRLLLIGILVSSVCAPPVSAAERTQESANETPVFAGHANRPDLTSIHKIATAPISETDNRPLLRKWYDLRFVQSLDAFSVWTWVLRIGGILTLILVVVFMWNRRLQKTVAKRTQDLRDSRSVLRSFFDNSPMYMGTVVLENGDIVHTSVNRPMADLLESTPAEIINHPISEFTASQGFVGSWEKNFRKSRSGGKPITFDYAHKGTEVSSLLSVTVFPISDKQSQRDLFAYIAEDVTERKQLNMQLIHSAKMATLGRVASGIAHEISQPLNIIRMTVEALSMSLADKGAGLGYGVSRLHVVEQQVVRMAKIVDHMCMFAREEQNQFSSFSVGDSVKSAGMLLESQLKSSGIKLDLDVASSRNIVGHPIQLEQVILNLVTNAKHAIESSRGEITSNGTVSIRALDGWRDDKVLITVSDNGGGIPEDVLPRIFYPFFTTKDESKGTGLGLSICFGIIKSMNGTITAENIGEGARFSIVLPIDGGTTPLTAPENQDEITSEEIACPHERLKVLVVDDEPLTTKLVAEFLAQLGYTVETAANGKEGLELFLKDPADGVITDLRMPVMNGNQFIRELRSVVPDLPIFVMTGNTLIGDEQPALSEDVNAVFRKPVHLKSIAALLRQSFMD